MSSQERSAPKQLEPLASSANARRLLEERHAVLIDIGRTDKARIAHQLVLLICTPCMMVCSFFKFLLPGDITPEREVRLEDPAR